MEGMASIKEILERARVKLSTTSAVSEPSIIWTKHNRPTSCVCDGDGYYPLHTESGDVEYAMCPCRHDPARIEISEQRRFELYHRSGLPGPLRRCTFENYDRSRQDNQRMWEAAKTFVDERLKYLFSEAYQRGEPSETLPWLAFFGRRGTGKTHLCVAICQAFITRGIQPTYRYVPDLLDELRAAYAKKEAEENYYAKLEGFKTAGVLILDDMAAEKDSPWTEEQLNKITDYRCRNELTTVITTNKGIAARDGDPKQVDELPLRVADRLRDNALCRRVVNEEQSYRPHNRRETHAR